MCRELEYLLSSSTVGSTFNPRQYLQSLEIPKQISYVLCEYSDLTTLHPQWKIPLENPWKCYFRDFKFQNVPRGLSLWRKLQSRLLFIISLPLENFLTALTCKW